MAKFWGWKSCPDQVGKQQKWPITQQKTYTANDNKDEVEENNRGNSCGHPPRINKQRVWGKI